jgi:hypothetical protein
MLYRHAYVEDAFVQTSTHLDEDSKRQGYEHILRCGDGWNRHNEILINKTKK